MSDAMTLRRMHTISQGEVRSLADLIELHRRKRTRGEAWFIQQAEILKYRQTVVRMIGDEISRRQEGEAA